MKIGKEIFLAMLWVSLLVLVLFAIANFFQLAGIRANISDAHNMGSDLLIETNLDVLTGFNQDMVTSLALVYSESLERKFAAVRSQLLLVRNYLETSYYIGIEAYSEYDDCTINLRDGVNFEDIAEELGSIRSVRDLIGNIFAASPASWIYFASESGIFIEKGLAEDELHVDYAGMDFRTRDWYIGAAESGDVYWTSVRTDARTGELEISVAAPVYGPDGHLMGVAGSSMMLDYLGNVVLSVDTDIIKFTFFVDGDGNFLFGSVPGRDIADFVPNRETREALYAAMIWGPEGVGLFEQDETMAGFARIPSTGWRVGVLIDYEKIRGPITRIDELIYAIGGDFTRHLNDAVRSVILVSAAIAAVIIALTVLLSRKVAGSITRPLKILTYGVGKISGGNLEHKIEFSSGNELETLADSFNAMTESLREHVKNLLAMHTENERISTELNIAKHIQAAMLPRIFPPFPERDEFEIYATMEPAKEVGGDFYDFFFTDDDNLVFVIADVSGKGVPAALFMVIAKTLINSGARLKSNPQDVFTRVNSQLCESNETAMFVTAWIGALHIPTGKLTYVNAGHNPPLLKRAGGRYEYLKNERGCMLAVIDGFEYHQLELALEKGDTLFLYTDGVTEANNASEELYSEARLQETLNIGENLNPTELLPEVKESIDRFAGNTPQFDDITMLALKIK